MEARGCEEFGGEGLGRSGALDLIILQAEDFELQRYKQGQRREQVIVSECGERGEPREGIC